MGHEIDRPEFSRNAPQNDGVMESKLALTPGVEDDPDGSIKDEVGFDAAQGARSGSAFRQLGWWTRDGRDMRSAMKEIQRS